MVIFARLMRWPLVAIALRPWLVPAVAVGLGWTTGAGLDRLLPAAGGLALRWAMLGAVAAAAALAALAVTVVTRFFDWREARLLLATLGRTTPAPRDA